MERSAERANSSFRFVKIHRELNGAKRMLCNQKIYGFKCLKLHVFMPEPIFAKSWRCAVVINLSGGIVARDPNRRSDKSPQG